MERPFKIGDIVSINRKMSRYEAIELLKKVQGKYADWLIDHIVEYSHVLFGAPLRVDGVEGDWYTGVNDVHVSMLDNDSGKIPIGRWVFSGMLTQLLSEQSELDEMLDEFS